MDEVYSVLGTMVSAYQGWDVVLPASFQKACATKRIKLTDRPFDLVAFLFNLKWIQKYTSIFVNAQSTCAVGLSQRLLQ